MVIVAYLAKALRVPKSDVRGERGKLNSVGVRGRGEEGRVLVVSATSRG